MLMVMSPIPDLWCIALIVPESLVEFFSDGVAEHVVSESTFEIEEGGNWLIEAISHGEPDRPWLIARVAEPPGLIRGGGGAGGGAGDRGAENHDRAGPQARLADQVLSELPADPR